MYYYLCFTDEETKVQKVKDLPKATQSVKHNVF